MEASLSSTMSRGYSETLLVKKRVKLPSWNRCLASISPTRAVAPPLFAQAGILTGKPRNVKVLCSQKREIPVVGGMYGIFKCRKLFNRPNCVMQTCIDEIYERLVPKAAVASNPNLNTLWSAATRHIVGLVGPPGAGKSTLASEVARRVNKLWPQKDSSIDSQVRPSEVATVLPMDGFHLYRSQLDEMENPEEAHARRGGEGSVYVPSFDHGVGDPVEDDIFVSCQFIEVDIDTAMQRVLKRHISTGKPPDVAKWRIEYNDQPNAELIINLKKNADLVIKSVDF